MGIYLNPGNEAFAEAIHSEIYVDKTGMLEYTNRVLGTKQKFICVSRPRRFGKSMAAEMLAAYYSRGCRSAELFRGLQGEKIDSFEWHLNRYDVLHLDVQWFRSNTESPGQTVSLLQEEVIRELRQAYPEYVKAADKSLPFVLANIWEATKRQFIIIIDEWDCLFREDRFDKDLQQEYLELLRGLFKGVQSNLFVKMAYMTGILPIKKYGTQSALNNFEEFSMLDPGILAEYVGFTEEETKALCDRYQMDFEETRRWYDGYSFQDIPHVYCPQSVIDLMRRRRFGNYWTRTDTYEVLKTYIEINFEGLKDDVIDMIGGGRRRINPRTFQNDMTSFSSKDDVFTLLVHLGYLAYDSDRREVFIPNMEVADEFTGAVEGAGWREVCQAL